MRATWLTIVGIALIILSLSAYNWWQYANNRTLSLPPNLKLIGVLDMDKNHGISTSGLKNGDDVLVVLDYAGFVNDFIPAHPELKDFYGLPFDLIYFDTTHSGEIDSEEPIWPYLYIVTYSDEGATYQVKHLNDGGIHAILAPHISAEGNHEVLLSDGDRRILYETKNI